MPDTTDYDYDLPRHLIAQQPLARRSDARLLVVDRKAETILHVHVRDLPGLLKPNDCLVLNDTEVVPARLVGYRTSTKGRWEGLFLSANDQGEWRILGKARGKLVPDETIMLINELARDDFRLRLLAKDAEGVWLVRPEPLRPEPPADTWQLLKRVGRVPLPHYIRAGEMSEIDRERYQTIYAAAPGSVAAPTAGLHFTRELLGNVKSHGTSIAKVTLHVGMGTFRPISTDRIEDHQMHAEYGQIAAEACASINRCRAGGGRIIAVGTTSVRTLESAAIAGLPLSPWMGETRLFIQSREQFKIVDGLMTNFHLPRTTLLVLVRSFGGDRLIKRAYEEAIREEYRFYSYGDAMLIL